MLFISSTDVYLSLNGEVIPNHGYVEISDIGSSDTTALLCHTNKPAPDGANSGGHWFAPDGTIVGGLMSTNVPGFGRNRDPMLVRLRRSNSGTSYEGIYWCDVNDAAETSQTVYVGLYNTGGGMYIITSLLCLSYITVHFIIALSTNYFRSDYNINC